MAFVRWEPVRELSSLQHEMNRLFNGFFDHSQANGSAQGARFLPAMDLVETDDHLVLRADLPGLAEGDVKIELEDNVLTISGERKAEHQNGDEGYRRIERAHGRFSRSLTLPEGIDGSAIAAKFTRGVLEVRIPKPEERRPRRVTIGLSEAADGDDHRKVDVAQAPSAATKAPLA